jgi:hypothetical protein
MICPRCRSTEANTVAHSPIADVWTMNSCPTCWYAWRSTEPAAATHPDLYPDDIAAAPRII